MIVSPRLREHPVPPVSRSPGRLRLAAAALKLTKISAAADQPANVALYLDVKDKAGRPIPGLQEKNFSVYEDGKLVTTSKAKRALLEPKRFDGATCCCSST